MFSFDEMEEEVSLHPDTPLGDTPLECYSCGQKNIFLLGFVPCRTDSVVVLLCRDPCLNANAMKTEKWDINNWCPLIQNR
mmetsp:Transcript_19362/g.8988  ORF Transcript_19362/g.8988 Transcript_19362/m.8988 type:complete len:80 (-) Transcript_19362:387-626(-)